jgi:3-hydroxybutyryl-CoA dehydrogenase
MKYTNKQILIIGSGTMGSGIAHTFAQFHFPVYLYDSNAAALEKAMNQIHSNIERQISKGSIALSDKETILKCITPTNDIAFAAKKSFLIIEAVPESLEIKRQVFETLDQICDPATILASNTSSISITQLAHFTKRPDKVIGMHFMNPVPIMPLVEVISSTSTSKETTQIVIEIAKELNKIPVCTADFPGFVANRILMPMINEAICALDQGVAGVEEIDLIMKLGMAHPMGPLQLADYIGLDICLNIMHVLHTGFGSEKYAPSPLLVSMVESGCLGSKTKKGFYNWDNPKALTVHYIKK